MITMDIADNERLWAFFFLEENKSVLEGKLWLWDSSLYLAERPAVGSLLRHVLQQFGDTVNTEKFVKATRRHNFYQSPRKDFLINYVESS